VTLSNQVEEWKPVPGASLIEVSTEGLVWSHRKRKLLTQTPNNKGYLRVRYVNDAGERVSRLVHVLVLEAFVSPRPPGWQACHGAGGQTDNRLPNLRWGSPEANLRDRYGEQWPCPRCHGTGYVRSYGA
jgi:hypothetical protein